MSAKFVVRQSRKKVRLTTKFLSIYGRTLGSPCGRAGERSETERGEKGASQKAAKRKRGCVMACTASIHLAFFCSAGPEGEGGCFDSPSLPPLDSLPTRNDQGVSPWTQKAEGRSGRLAEKALYCALEEIAHRFFRAPAARRSDFVCAPCGRAFSPLSAACGGTSPGGRGKCTPVGVG